MNCDPDTDELLSRVERGDPSATAMLLQRHRDRLRRMVWARLDKRLLPRVDPSDVVQEALAEAALKLAEYVRERPVPFYPWLRRLAWEHLVRLHERHLTAKRRSVAREQISFPRFPDQSADELVKRLTTSELRPDYQLIAAELRSRVMSALSEMSDQDREILVLRYVEQLSNAEIAEVLDISEGTVRTRHTRALNRLARQIKRIDEGSP